MWAVSASTIAVCSAKVGRQLDDRKVPLMGVLGAFIFAAQMINFSIPGTGSSGHLAGGLLLSILLGPSAAFLTIASVLVVQALFFADGGLLALGCNIFNMGFFPAFLVYPFIYRRALGERPGRGRLTAVTVLSAVIGLQLGAFSVVMETFFSGISSLPFSTFLALMQPIHLAIGLVEGAVTVAVVSFVRNARPELLHESRTTSAGVFSGRRVLVSLLAVAVLTAGVLSWYACQDPDGLEWSVAKLTGSPELSGPKSSVHRALASLQGDIALFPDYNFKTAGEASAKTESAAQHPSKEVGTSAAGLLGTLLTLVLAFLAGFLLKRIGHSPLRTSSSLKG